MKRIICIVLTSVFLVACSEQLVSEVPSKDDTRFTGLGDSIKIITDNQTGCKYIYVKDGVGDQSTAGLSPLIKSNGEVDCNKLLNNKGE